MNLVKTMIMMTMLTSCSTFTTGISTALKFEHVVEAATEAALIESSKS